MDVVLVALGSHEDLGLASSERIFVNWLLHLLLVLNCLSLMEERVLRLERVRADALSLQEQIFLGNNGGFEL